MGIALVLVVVCAGAIEGDRPLGAMPAFGDSARPVERAPVEPWVPVAAAAGGVVVGGAVGTGAAMLSFLSTTDGNFTPFLVLAPVVVTAGLFFGPVVALAFVDGDVPGWVGPAAGVAALGAGVFFFVGGVVVLSVFYDAVFVDGADDVANAGLVVGPFVVAVVGAAAAAGAVAWFAVEE